MLAYAVFNTLKYDAILSLLSLPTPIPRMVQGKPKWKSVHCTVHANVKNESLFFFSDEPGDFQNPPACKNLKLGGSFGNARFWARQQLKSGKNLQGTETRIRSTFKDVIEIKNITCKDKKKKSINVTRKSLN